MEHNWWVRRFELPSLYYLKHFFWAQKILLDQVQDRKIQDKIVEIEEARVQLPSSNCYYVVLLWGWVFCVSLCFYTLSLYLTRIQLFFFSFFAEYKYPTFKNNKLKLKHKPKYIIQWDSFQIQEWQILSIQTKKWQILPNTWILNLY